jgi:response regulator of citrate/malate metabolism
MLTAERNAEIVARANHAGVTHWLLKPYKTEDLLAVVAKNAGPP